MLPRPIATKRMEPQRRDRFQPGEVRRVAQNLDALHEAAADRGSVCPNRRPFAHGLPLKPTGAEAYVHPRTLRVRGDSCHRNS